MERRARDEREEKGRRGSSSREREDPSEASAPEQEELADEIETVETTGDADPEELMGESEHSVRASNAPREPKGSSGRKSKPPGRSDISQRPEELGRRWLEDATEAPGKSDR